MFMLNFLGISCKLLIVSKLLTAALQREMLSLKVQTCLLSISVPNFTCLAPMIYRHPTESTKTLLMTDSLVIYTVQEYYVYTSFVRKVLRLI